MTTTLTTDFNDQRGCFSVFCSNAAAHLSIRNLHLHPGVYGCTLACLSARCEKYFSKGSVEGTTWAKEDILEQCDSHDALRDLASKQ